MLHVQSRETSVVAVSTKHSRRLKSCSYCRVFPELVKQVLAKVRKVLPANATLDDQCNVDTSTGSYQQWYSCAQRAECQQLL